MSTKHGRAPSGQALVSDEAAAHLHPSGFDPSRWREPQTMPRDGTIFAVWFYPWRVKTNDPRIQLAQWIDLYGNGGKLCSPWDYDSEPYAEGWLPLEEINSAIAMEAATAGETTEIGSTGTATARAESIAQKGSK